MRKDEFSLVDKAIRQATIDALSEVKEEISHFKCTDYVDEFCTKAHEGALCIQHDILSFIQEKINALKGGENVKEN